MSKLEKEPLRCLFDIRSVPLQVYRLPTDSRRWAQVCGNRRQLAIQLASYANPDGTSITVGCSRLIQEIGFSHSKLFRLLAELDELGFLVTDGKTGRHGTAIRQLNLDQIQSKMAATESHEGGLQSPTNEPQSPTNHFTKSHEEGLSDPTKSHEATTESHEAGTKSHLGGTQPLTGRDRHTHTHRVTEQKSVCVSGDKKPSAMEEQEPNPSSINKTQDNEKAIRVLLAMASGWTAREKDKTNWRLLLEKMPVTLFLAAGRQYFENPPDAVNDRTNFKWQFFYDDINRCVALAKKAEATRLKAVADEPELRRKNHVMNRQDKVRLINYPHKKAYLASLPQEDRDYIEAVSTATTPEELPPDNGKTYEPLMASWFSKRGYYL